MFDTTINEVNNPELKSLEFEIRSVRSRIAQLKIAIEENELYLEDLYNQHKNVRNTPPTPVR